MEARAIARYVRVTPRKVNQLLDTVRGKDVSFVLVHLTFSKRHVAKKIEKTMRSAVANAIQADSNLDVDDLYVKEALVGPAPIMKRFLPRAQGRATRFWKRSSHITIILEDKASRKTKRRKTASRPAALAGAPKPKAAGGAGIPTKAKAKAKATAAPGTKSKSKAKPKAKAKA